MNNDALRTIGRLQAERDALVGFLLEVAQKLVPRKVPETDLILDYLEKLFPGFEATSQMVEDLHSK